MAKVKMFLDLDFDELQKVKSRILNLNFNEQEKTDYVLRLAKIHQFEEIKTAVVGLIEKVQDQSVDNPENKFTHKQVYGS